MEEKVVNQALSAVAKKDWTKGDVAKIGLFALLIWFIVRQFGVWSEIDKDLKNMR